MCPSATTTAGSRSNPEYLIAEVAKRHDEWNKFAPMVRDIKAWKDYVGLEMKSLVAEVLVLNNLPHPPYLGTLSRQEALKGFFTAAASAVMNGVHDPAGLCGESSPTLTDSPCASKCWSPPTWPREHALRRPTATTLTPSASGGASSVPTSRYRPAGAPAREQERLPGPLSPVLPSSGRRH